MEHSIQKYLERRTTEELEAVLQFCLREENIKDYKYAVMEILRVLERRYEPPADGYPPHVQKAWEKYLRNISE